MIRSALLCAAGALILGVVALTVPYGGQPTVTLPVGAANAQTAIEDIDTSIVEEMVLGDAEAPVTVVEYASFTCPHCRRFHEGPFKQIKENYIDTGKVKLIYREVYFDRYGLWAGMVARCGGPVRYFGLADLIYERQAEWAQGAPAEIGDNLRQIGRVAGLTDAQLDTCLSDADKAQAMVAVYQTNSEKDQVSSTPTFFIDGTKYGNMTYDEFAAILDERLGE